VGNLLSFLPAEHSPSAVEIMSVKITICTVVFDKSAPLGVEDGDVISAVGTFHFVVRLFFAGSLTVARMRRRLVEVQAPLFLGRSTRRRRRVRAAPRF